MAVPLEPPNEKLACLGGSTAAFVPKEKLEVELFVVVEALNVLAAAGAVLLEAPKAKTLEELVPSFLATSPKVKPESSFFFSGAPKVKLGASETAGLTKPNVDAVDDDVVVVAAVVPVVLEDAPNTNVEGVLEGFPKL